MTLQMNTLDKITDDQFIERIYGCDQKLKDKYADKMTINKSLNRKVVSFQANKKVPFFRWFKYKEGFSSSLVTNFILSNNNNNSIKKILDPFAGSGSTLFVASDLGIDSVGIELLPIGQKLIKARNILINDCNISDFERIKFWFTEKPWINFNKKIDFSVLKITNGAYPEETLNLVKQYLACLESENIKLQEILRMALFCVLENISYTRKDGQYLRWDYRSGRKIGTNPFDKGLIRGFNEAITDKIQEIYEDSIEINIDLFQIQKDNKKGAIDVIGGSCLMELQNIHTNSVNLTITSPPYCNRYDYTRTYALELAMLGVDEARMVELRQEMLSCTVENRAKDLIKICKDWHSPLSVVENHTLLQEIITYLEHKKKQKTLNNSGLPRMVKGYFYEMACVIHELFRVTSSGGKVVMVNDNVRYAGASVSVDLILSDIANSLGFNVDKIEILPIGKGNSSQQMGEHGRDALRKCVYTWSKP